MGKQNVNLLKKLTQFFEIDEVFCAPYGTSKETMEVTHSSYTRTIRGKHERNVFRSLMLLTAIIIIIISNLFQSRGRNFGELKSNF